MLAVVGVEEESVTETCRKASNCAASAKARRRRSKSVAEVVVILFMKGRSFGGTWQESVDPHLAVSVHPHLANGRMTFLRLSHEIR